MNAQVFDLPDKMTRVFDRDLKFAGIAKADAHGRVVDVHSLRHRYATILARAGVPLQTAQKLMRHSDPALTANVYSHLGLMDISAAIAQLPNLPSLDNEEQDAVAHAEDDPSLTVSVTVSRSGNLSTVRSFPGSQDTFEKDSVEKEEPREKSRK